MGLDMYLYVERGVYSFLDEEQYEEVKRFVESRVMGTPLKEDSKRPWGGAYSVRHEVAYWRKANAIHSWFVENVQDGVDECQLSYVSLEHLESLVNSCSRVLELLNPFCAEAYDVNDWELGKEIPFRVKEEAEEILTPTGGFFFGSTDIDMYFYNTVRYTHDRLGEVLEWIRGEHEGNRFWSVFYRSSW